MNGRNLFSELHSIGNETVLLVPIRMGAEIAAKILLFVCVNHHAADCAQKHISQSHVVSSFTENYKSEQALMKDSTNYASVYSSLANETALLYTEKEVNWCRLLRLCSKTVF